LENFRRLQVKLWEILIFEKSMVLPFLQFPGITGLFTIWGPRQNLIQTISCL